MEGLPVTPFAFGRYAPGKLAPGLTAPTQHCVRRLVIDLSLIYAIGVIGWILMSIVMFIFTLHCYAVIGRVSVLINPVWYLFPEYFPKDRPGLQKNYIISLTAYVLYGILLLQYSPKQESSRSEQVDPCAQFDTRTIYKDSTAALFSQTPNEPLGLT